MDKLYQFQGMLYCLTMMVFGASYFFRKFSPKLFFTRKVLPLISLTLFLFVSNQFLYFHIFLISSLIIILSQLIDAYFSDEKIGVLIILFNLLSFIFFNVSSYFVNAFNGEGKGVVYCYLIFNFIIIFFAIPCFLNKISVLNFFKRFDW